MNPEDRLPAPLEQAVSEIRAEEISEADVDTAASRVWQRLGVSITAPCQALAGNRPRRRRMAAPRRRIVTKQMSSRFSRDSSG